MNKLTLAVTGASGMLTAKILLEKSPWPVALVASDWGREVYEREVGPFEGLQKMAAEVLDNEDLGASLASGSVESAGMLVAPCSANTMGQIASGVSPSLITRAAHCHLKERRPLVLCVRETPWSLIDLDNARSVAAAGGAVMPISPPFFMTAQRDPDRVSMAELLGLYADRVLKLLGHPAPITWESVK
jgi:4-hydroxy-3-polyprenylbenzoate decarboxylase